MMTTFSERSCAADDEVALDVGKLSEFRYLAPREHFRK